MPDLEQLYPDDDQQYQVINGFRLPVPKGATGDSEITRSPGLKDLGLQPPVPSSDPAASATITDTPSGPKFSMGALPLNGAPEARVMGPSANRSGNAIQADTLAHDISMRPPPAPPSLSEAQTPGVPTYAQLMSDSYRLRQPLIKPGEKVPQQYRMGIGERLLGALGNFASGVAGKGPVSYIGPGATNRQYGQDVERRGEQLTAADLAMRNQEKLSDENRKMFEAANKGAYEAQVGDARQRTSQAQQETADTRRQLASSQDELNRARANKADADPTAKATVEAGARAKLADQYGLKGRERQMFILTGKLEKDADPMAEVRAELARMRLDDAQAGRVDKVTKDAEAETKAHKADIQKRIDKVEEQYGSLPGEAVNPANDQKRKQAMAQIERDDYQGMNRIAGSLSTRLRGFGVNVTPPRAQPWAQSNLDEGERNQLLQAAPIAAAPAPTAAPQTPRAPSARPATPQLRQNMTVTTKTARDFGEAPPGKAEGSTGKLPDGTPVVVRGGRIVSQPSKTE